MLLKHAPEAPKLPLEALKSQKSTYTATKGLKMTIDEYKKLFPLENVWRVKGDWLHRNCSFQYGMLLFDDSASHFAGPFDGNYAYFELTEHKNPPKIADLKQQARFAPYNLPYEIRPKKIQSEEHLQVLLGKMTAKQLKQWEKQIGEREIEYATVEFPWSFHLAGNDDATYTKFFATKEVLLDEFKFFSASQPLNFEIFVSKNGFVFTN